MLLSRRCPADTCHFLTGSAVLIVDIVHLQTSLITSLFKRLSIRCLFLCIDRLVLFVGLSTAVLGFASSRIIRAIISMDLLFSIWSGCGSFWCVSLQLTDLHGRRAGPPSDIFFRLFCRLALFSTFWFRVFCLLLQKFLDESGR